MSGLSVQDERVREYVRKHFRRAKTMRRRALFTGAMVTMIIVTTIAWAVALADAEPLVGMFLMTVVAVLGLFFHGLSAGLEGETGDRDIKRQLVMQAQLHALAGGLDDDLDDIDVGDSDGEKRKRDRLTRRVEDEVDLDLEAEIAAARARRARRDD
jgi:hypothetical protein